MYRLVDDARFAHPIFLPPELGAATQLYESRRAEEALEELQRQAESNPAARAVLAALHMTGNLELPIDRNKSRVYCADDARDGYAYAQYLLAWLCVEERDATQAVNWMRKAAMAHFPPAELDMGRFYLNGIGVSKDYDLALDWLWKAWRAGHVIALRYLLQQYKKGRRGPVAQLFASAAWPFSGMYLHLFTRLAGPYDVRYFFYNWPLVGGK